MRTQSLSGIIFIVVSTLIGACTPSSFAIDLADPDGRSKAWGDDTYFAQARPLIVTASAPPTGGDRLSLPGDPASSSGVNVDGGCPSVYRCRPSARFGRYLQRVFTVDGPAPADRGALRDGRRRVRCCN